ncbi:hypothetical protein HNQ41_000598 [Texcoconibacillus texcoconensis]|uniref:Uncharacterized protein n=1 Tax=Texcoconibacillus texcoconensis TaxID=1095777 RepID=A0A840QM59_9BACI|nr:hypothetical protein [Texcoconibacillus texcoconensis]
MKSIEYKRRFIGLKQEPVLNYVVRLPGGEVEKWVKQKPLFIYVI